MSLKLYEVDLLNVAKSDKPDIEALDKFVPELLERLPEKDAEYSWSPLYRLVRNKISLHELTKLSEGGVSLAVRSVSSIDVGFNFNEFAHKAEQQLLANADVSVNNYNQRVDVHMPGQALAMYNELMLLEDSCTDRVAESLDNGWRIIACCPQPDQRRPDYVLGRYNPNRVIKSEGAGR